MDKQALFSGSVSWLVDRLGHELCHAFFGDGMQDGAIDKEHCVFKLSLRLRRRAIGSRSSTDYDGTLNAIVRLVTHTDTSSSIFLLDCRECCNEEKFGDW